MYLEEERSRILARVEELQQKVDELGQQLQETNHEVVPHFLKYLAIKYYIIQEILPGFLLIFVYRWKWSKLCCKQRGRLSRSKWRLNTKLYASCSSNSASWTKPHRKRRTR